tara:strand:+ start:232 stop:456 length:225 start_codon:yes stop_codon:yes gene_type:complete
MDDFETLKKNKCELEEKKRSLKLELDSIEYELNLCTKQLYSKCVEDGGHYLRRERDNQLYSEVTLTCVNCGYIK